MKSSILTKIFFTLQFFAVFFLFVGTSRAWIPSVVGGKCKQTGYRCSSTIGNAGGRGACCDPSVSPSRLNSCVNNNPCIGGAPYRWRTLPVIWWFNPNGMPGKAGYRGFSTSDIESAFKKAWDVWTKPNCTNFQHSYQGQTSAVVTRGGSIDRKNVLFLATPSEWAGMGVGSMTLAFTLPIPTRTGELIDADIVFNPYPGGRSWKIYPNVRYNETDLLAVAAHEIGHAIGFAHTQITAGLMYYANKPGPFKGLHQDDISAVCYTYPGRCSKDSDCGSCMYCPNGKCVLKPIQPIPQLCKPCTSSSQCGGSSDVCLRLPGQGNRCVQDCSKNGCCPKGYRCTDVGFGLKTCLPESGKCPDVRCSSDQQCGPGESCQYGVCKPKPVPLDPNSCKGCTSDSQCGGNNKCVQFADGKSRCVQPCVAGNFCPTGYTCKGAGSGRYCFPAQQFCPCRGSSDCLSGEVCRNGFCRPSSCKYACPCSDKAPCDPPYRCFQTPQGGICLQPCGSSAGGSFSAGSPGSPCSSGQCRLGASCYRVQNGGTICLRPCRSSSQCSYGGRCYSIGNGQSFCLCTSDSECLSGQKCNKSLLQRAGACANSSGSSTCEPGYTCKDVGGTQICQPKPTRKAGEICSNTQPCLPGLICIVTSKNSSQGICLEDCTQSNTCKYGGSCVIQATGNKKFCGCFYNSHCKSGETCKKAFGQAGYCVKGGGSNNSCGNGVCERSKGEDCGTCPRDCRCSSGRVCRNNRCVPVQNNSCGNGTCERDKGEDCGTCPRDCRCSSGRVCRNNRCVPVQNNSCGNGTCERDKGEDCGTCPSDCVCPTGKTCQNNRCVPGQSSSCGNNTCERDKGEDCGTCPSDCVCPAGKTCQNNRCIALEKTNREQLPNCPPDQRVQKCDQSGANCRWVCPDEGADPAGAGCSGCSVVSSDGLGEFPLWLFLLFGLLIPWGLKGENRGEF